MEPDERPCKVARLSEVSDSTLRDGAQLLCDYVEDLWSDTGRERKTVELRSPDELVAAFSESGCSLDLSDSKPVSKAELLDACRLTLKFSVKSNHPKFYNQLYGRIEPVGLLGQWLATATAGNCHTYEVAPVFTLTEVHTLRKLASKLNFPIESEGLFVPGGSIANLYGMHLARYKAFPQVKTEGMWACPPLAAFCSDHAHYSYSKAANVIGLGTDNLIKVASDASGSMRPEALRDAIGAAIAAGKRPFFVGATEGTTVMGGFDNLRELRGICDEHHVWLHADCSWGGAAILSSRTETRDLLAGVDAADSVAWNPHKLMGIPMQCSAFLTRHNGMLLQCNKYGAAYLFQPDKLYSDLDIGDKTIQCGRLPDSFKLWLAWKHVGDEGWAKRVDKAVDLAKHMADRMQKSGLYTGRFHLVAPLSFTNLCFWYFPPGMKSLYQEVVDNPQCIKSPSSECWQKLHSVAPKIKSRMQQKGQAMIGFQSIPLEGGSEPLPNFFRMVFASVWSVAEADIDESLSDIDAAGAELFPTLNGHAPWGNA